MAQSWKQEKHVSQDTLQERIEMIKALNGSENELYEIVKDRETGDHYLHYSYRHLHVGDGNEEFFHQLLPLDSDDVLAVMFGEQLYTYPEHWSKPFLRNGPDGTYVWFDPGELEPEAEQERRAEEAFGMLKAFKSKGRSDEQSVRELLERIEKKLSGEDGE
ncbi:hypothetical protein [Paenibacillus koleovorans]|uniref:hypothetical protein n=1 Tax=Paenibacillus koleovorans TaxID=121608 RepID=UPI000FD9194E|nr:hypothetical protein [Paenibacillus koleovorans]